VRLADIQFRLDGSSVIARVIGEVDLSNAEEMGSALTHGLADGARELVLDLSALEYLDSAGIQLIYRLREDLQARGQGLRLVIPAGSPSHDALRLAGVSQHVQTFATVRAALAVGS
jgi:stage II sporulation protein AA (anti-sigma F factor antagonist)